MYKMKADGVVFYDPYSDDMTLQVLSPKAKYELNKAGSLTFTLLPGNVAYNSLHKLKTVVTLEQDGEIIFRGRVLETTSDLYNQKKVYCEGELAFLLDSLVRPYQFKGKAADLFRQLVTKHNEQVEDYKRFEVGIITAVTDEDDLETEGDGYADTLSEIQSLLLDGFGGYLRVRREDGKNYLDYVDAFNQTCPQEINFGVNLVDIESKLNAQDVCTALVPLGKECGDKPATIESVNGGKDYIEDTEGIAKFGRIIKTHTWEEVEDPAELLKLAQEYMSVMNAEKTLTITAVALQGIRLGDTVKLLSLPHGLDKEDVCTAIDLDIEKPEKSDYTFGFPLETLTESNARTIKGLSSAIHHTHRWLTETETALNINVEATNLIGHRTTQLEIDVDAAKEAITLKADQTSVDILESRVSGAEVRIDAAEAAIELKANQAVVDEVGERLSSAELRIDGAEAAIKLRATKEEVNSVSSTLSTVQADLDAAKATISLKASQSTVDALGNRVSSAELRLDGAEAAIKLKASADDLNAVELRLDGMNSTITAKADLVRVEALETEITGLLKVENLQAAIADLADVAVSQLSVSGTAHCTNLSVHGAGSVDGDLSVSGELNCSGLSINGEDFSPADYVTGSSLSGTLSNYATRSWVLERNYVSASDVSTTLDSYVMKADLESKGTYVITSISTTTYDGYVTGVHYNREWITYYA